ncbi:MAG: hypothetical protein A2Y62_08265 [Candidatus Fischerbacteria bacterium RBG_13_37_8]|uniref:DUF4253 domain-containing protein n=1 Tax=Candidatus Fischerbacteria bacterium RBG_13_37_8 TaxID=1817863 RepID=A0A1F5VML6_9BACT|nr:MAG: hypothetical protein A2Y62_08265 [Candidatus Fischerbacteria bacterium RBG_13_37_8]
MTSKQVLGLFIMGCIVMVMAGGCSKENAVMKSEEKSLARQLNFDEKALQMLKDETGGTIQQLTAYSEDGSITTTEGISVGVPQDKAESVITKLRPEMRTMGYIIFLREMNFGGSPDMIGVIKGTDKYEVLRLMQTNGANYDLSTEDVIAKLKEWEARYPFELFGADFDWVEVDLKEVPSDIEAFAHEVHEFCPDVVEQGTETVEALADEISRRKKIYLWWD